MPRRSLSPCLVLSAECKDASEVRCWPPARGIRTRPSPPRWACVKRPWVYGGSGGSREAPVWRHWSNAPLREAVSRLSRDVHGGTGLPAVGTGLRNAAGTLKPLDAPGTGARSRPPGPCGADFRDPRGSFFKIRGISSRLEPATG